MTEFQYKRTTTAQRLQMQALPRADLLSHQLNRINELLARILPANQFYRDKLSTASVSSKLSELDDLSQLAEFPFTCKQDLINQTDPAGFANNLTFAPDAYTRFHRTSGTSGRPMIVLDLSLIHI